MQSGPAKARSGSILLSKTFPLEEFMKLNARIILFVLSFCFSLTPIYSQTTEFTYQGSLKDGTNVAIGNYDFEFALFDSLSAGTQIGTTLTRNTVAVANGTFAVKLDFGSQFPGANRFLEIRVRLSGGRALTTLAPRQAVGSSPYAVKSLTSDTAANATNAATANNATSLGGVAAAQYVLTGDARLSDARAPTAGSANYIQNGTAPQAASNFNISGTGNANIFNAGTQFNIGGVRILSSQGGNLTVGLQAGNSNSGTLRNSFVGETAGYANTSGLSNSFFGFGSGYNSISGSSNSFFGSESGFNTTSGNGNAYFGATSGFNTTTGVSNSFVGYRSGQSNITGNSNSYFGSYAGTSGTTGSKNTIIGGGADFGANNLTNATALGANALVAQNNSLVLGSINGVNNATADTNVGIGTTAPAYPLSVAGGAGSNANQAAVEFTNSSPDTGLRLKNTAASGRTWTLFSSGTGSSLGLGSFSIYDATAGQSRLSIDSTGNVALPTLGSAGATALCRNASNQIATCSSSLRYKTNITRFGFGLNLVKQLQPISFDWKQGGMHDLGLGAEDVAAIEPLLVTYNDKGQVEGVKYDRIGVVLVNAVKEQQAQIEILQQQVREQRAEIDAFKALVCSQNPSASVCRPNK